MRLCQLGSGDLFSHSLSIAFKQSLGSLYGPFKASRTPEENPSTSPMFSHSEQMTTSSVRTVTKSLGQSIPTAGDGGEQPEWMYILQVHVGRFYFLALTEKACKIFTHQLHIRIIMMFLCYTVVHSSLEMRLPCDIESVQITRER